MKPRRSGTNQKTKAVCLIQSVWCCAFGGGVVSVFDFCALLHTRAHTRKQRQLSILFHPPCFATQASPSRETAALEE